MKIEIPEVKKLVLRNDHPDPLGRHGRHEPCEQHHLFPLPGNGSHRMDAFHWLPTRPECGEGPVIVNAFCNFYKQLEYPGDVLLKMYVSDPARSTFESWGTMERTDDPGVVYAAGGATTIWVNFPAQKSAPLPQWMLPHLT
jgi:acyl-CoA thioester hydrolase